MKRTVILIALLLLVSLCFAADPTSYFKLNDRATVVDLKSNLYFTHQDSAGFSITDSKSYIVSASNYYKNQIVLTVGVMNVRETRTTAPDQAEGWYDYTEREGKYAKANGSVKITIAPAAGSQWYYILTEDREFKRPYGLDIFARGSYKESGSNNYEDVDLYEKSGISCVHVGLQNTAASNPVYLEIPASEVSKYEYIWFDVCLVLDPPVNQSMDTVTLNGNTTNIIASDAYYLTTLDINVEIGSLSDTYTTQLMGYYKPTDANSMKTASAYLFVEKLPVANGFDINETYHTGNWIDIARYDFSTDSKKYKTTVSDPGRVYIFLSSTRNATSQSEGRFTLTNSDNAGGQGENNAINYVLRFNPGTEYGSVGNNVYLDGTDIFSSDNMTDPDSAWLSITAEKNNYISGYYYARWHDSGTIQLAILPNEQDTRIYNLPVPDPQGMSRINLASGTYSSTIYVHVVTDFNPNSIQ